MQRPGDEIDIWVVEKALGSGGMGSVYRCHNRSAHRILAAVKVLDASLHRNADAKARFVREAEILFALDHPNIVKVRNVRSDGDPPYLEMEFVEGRSLEDLLWRGPIPQAEAVEMMAQCASALAYMHSRGVRHRDIKPSNLLVQPDGVVKMVDFGLAIEAGSDRLTQQGVTFGTVSYAPPEWMNPEALDPTLWDIYALGVVFYEMLTGDMAFPLSHDGSIRQQAMKVMIDKQGHAPLDPGTAFPESLRALIGGMTHSDAGQRIDAMERVSATLAQLRPDGGRSAITQIYETRPRRPQGLSQPATDAVQRWGAVAAGVFGLAGLAALVMAAIVAGAAFTTDQGPATEPEAVARGTLAEPVSGVVAPAPVPAEPAPVVPEPEPAIPEPEPAAEPVPVAVPTPAPIPVPTPAPAAAPEPAPPRGGPRVTVGQFSAWLADHPEWQREGERGVAQGGAYLKDWSGTDPPGGTSAGSAMTNVSYRAARAHCRSRGTDLAGLEDGPAVGDSMLEWRLGPKPDLAAAVGTGQRLTTGVPNMMSGTSFRCAR